jgi:hypothetical protein
MSFLSFLSYKKILILESIKNYYKKATNGKGRGLWLEIVMGLGIGIGMWSVLV